MKSIYKQLICISILLLLVGVNVTSAIRVENKTPIVESKDCSCNEVSDADIVKLEKRLDRLERYSNLLLMLSRYNPELQDKCEELSNQLSNINNLYDEFNTAILQQGKQSICIILEPLYVIVFVIFAFSYELAYQSLFSYHLLLFITFLFIHIVVAPIFMFIVGMVEEFECEPPI